MIKIRWGLRDTSTLTVYSVADNNSKAYRWGFLRFLETPLGLTSYHVKHCEITVYTIHSGTYVVYLDFSKAFDGASHHRLFHKLHHYDIHGDVLDW